MKPLGTILPTRESLEAGDRVYEAQLRKNNRTARETFKGIKPRREKGEDRYYVASDKFAIVSMRSGRVLWFEIRNGEEFAC
jgi:hypothetical protein